MKLDLHSDYHLRPDGRRSVLFAYKPFGMSNGDILILHPLTGFVLSLIDGSSDETQVAEELSFLLDKSHSTCRVLLSNIADNLRKLAGVPVIVPTNAAAARPLPVKRHHKPEAFIVDAASVELRSRKLQFPISINFIVTNSCSSRCVYCYAERESSPRRGQMPLQRILELVDEAGENGVVEIVFSGGDPLEWQHIVPTVKRTIERGIFPCLSTKAALSEKRCAELRDVGVQIFQYSLDSPNAHTANHLVGRKNFYHQAISSIRNLLRVGIDVGIKSVVTPLNFPEIPKLVSLMAELNVRRLHLVPYGRSAYRHSDSLFLEKGDDQLLRTVVSEQQARHPTVLISGFGLVDGAVPVQRERKTVAQNEKNGSDWERWKARPSLCSMGRTSFTILPDGAILMCEQLPSEARFVVGSVAQRSIREVWTSDEFTNATLRPARAPFEGSACYDCSEFTSCHEIRGRCIRDAFKSYGDPYQPDPRCPKAPTGARL